MQMRILFLVLSFILIHPRELAGQGADIRLLREINLNRNTTLDPAFRGFTNSVAPLCIGTPVIIFGVGYFTRDSALKRDALYTAGSMIVTSVITEIFKYSIDRTRPFETYPDIEKATSAHSPSFPSGHTSRAFSLATSLSLSYPKWYVIVPSYAWAATVAYSRMDLGVHYPSDVLAGIVIGTGSAYLFYKLNKKLKFK